MLASLLLRTADERRSRLFGCAAVRSVWSLLHDPRSRKAVEVAERYADGLATFEELLQAESDAWHAAADAAFVPTGAAAWARALEAGLDHPGSEPWQLAAQAWCAAAGAAWNAWGPISMAIHTVNADPVAERVLCVTWVVAARVAFQAAAAHREDGRRIAQLAAEAARTAAEGAGSRREVVLNLAEQARVRADAARASPAADARAAALAAWAAAEVVGQGWPAVEAAAESARLALDGGHAGQCELLRCLFGNPFRPPTNPDPSLLAWEDGLIPSLARSAYEDRALPSGLLDATRLAVLADALLDAGCTDVGMVEHLRQSALHVRGCWVVDRMRARK
jgi:hypothetical protein